MSAASCPVSRSTLRLFDPADPERPTAKKRRDDTVARLIASLEVSCACKLKIIPCGCAGPCDCLVRIEPCPHVAKAAHNVPEAKWIELLWAFAPKEYPHLNPANPRKKNGEPSYDLPLGNPALVMSRTARIELMMLRRLRGLSLYHPGDRLVELMDQVSVQAGKGRIQLDLTSTDDEDDLW